MDELLKNDMVMVQQGAEAKVYTGAFLGQPAIVKVRFSKKYRHSELDEKLSLRRMTQEARALLRCCKIGIKVPAVYFVDPERKLLVLERIEGSATLKDHIIDSYRKNESKCYPAHLLPVMLKIGQILAKLHDADIIHGDLTTSNILIRFSNEGNFIGKDFEIFLIDFGLSSSSKLAEDKGVDLYVLEKAFMSSHQNSENLFSELMDTYKAFSKNSASVLEKFREIKRRGRKRTMMG